MTAKALEKLLVRHGQHDVALVLRKNDSHLPATQKVYQP